MGPYSGYIKAKKYPQIAMDSIRKYWKGKKKKASINNGLKFILASITLLFGGMAGAELKIYPSDQEAPELYGGHILTPASESQSCESSRVYVSWLSLLRRELFCSA